MSCCEAESTSPNSCDYCDGAVGVASLKCSRCGYDYTALAATEEYCFE